MARKKKRSVTNAVPPTPRLWRLICRKPTISIWTTGTACGVSHKRKEGAVKKAKKEKAKK